MNLFEFLVECVCVTKPFVACNIRYTLYKLVCGSVHSTKYLVGQDQKVAIESVVDMFRGQDINRTEFSVS